MPSWKRKVSDVDVAKDTSIDLIRVITAFKCAELSIDSVQPVVKPSSYEYRSGIRKGYHRVPEIQTFDKIPSLKQTYRGGIR